MQPMSSRHGPARRHGSEDAPRPPLICVSGWGKKISCYSETLEWMHDIPTPGRNVRVVTIPPEEESDDDVLVAVSEYQRPYETYLYNPYTRNFVRKMQAKHFGRIEGLSSLSPSLVVSGDMDFKVYVSNVRSGEQLLTLRDPPKNSYRIVCNNSTRGLFEEEQLVFLSGGGSSESNPIRLFDLKSERPDEVARKFVGHTRTVLGLSYSSNDGLLVSTSWDETLRIWSIRDEQSSQSVSLRDRSYSVCYESESHLAFCGLRGGLIEVFDIRNTSQRVRKFRPQRHGYHGAKHGTNVYDITPTVPGTYASINDSSHSVALWTSKGKKIAVAVTHAFVYGVCYVDPQREDGAQEDHGAQDLLERFLYLMQLLDGDASHAGRKRIEVGCGPSLRFVAFSSFFVPLA